MRNHYLKRVSLKNVELTEGFWKQQLDKISQVTARDILEKFENDHEEGIMKNFEWVVEGKTGEHVGPPWYDGLIYEVIRGISDIISQNYDETLDLKIEEYTKKISAAQNIDPDGYINTYTTLICPNNKWGENGGSLIWQHDIYNIGCLVEAGVHYYLATGKINLLSCSIKAAMGMVNVMGEHPKKNIVPAHSLPEEALVKLYYLFEDDEMLYSQMKEAYNLEIDHNQFLDLATFWMNNRGVHHNRTSYPPYMGEYAQDHCKVEDQCEAVGHAVRASLMYTGLTSVGMAQNNEKFLKASHKIWNNVEKTKLHISGGIGAIHNEERFGFQYELPNNAYLETCAGVGLAFWAGELNLAYEDSKFMDVFERAMYNNILPGLSVDGTHYFYENPLISEGDIERWSWHSCPCCPPMYLKFMAALPTFIYTYKKDEIVLNLHMNSKAKIILSEHQIVVEQKDGNIPWSGNSTVVVTTEHPEVFTLSIRKPEWAKEYKVIIDNEAIETEEVSGFIKISRQWNGETKIRLELSMPATKIEAHPYVSADTGKVALQRGPILYCFEEVDNPQGVDSVLSTEELEVFEKDIYGTVPCLKTSFVDGNEVVAIPYYLWNNRGKGKMNVWIRQDEKIGSQERREENTSFAAHSLGQMAEYEDMNEWENILYREWKNPNQ